jgi:CNT family concentrative nucleoside transporter
MEAFSVENIWLLRATSLFGLVAMMLIAVLLSEDRRRIRPRLVLVAVLLQFMLGLLVLRTGAGAAFFSGIRQGFDLLSDASTAGASFLFGNLTRFFLIERVLVPGAGGLETTGPFPINAVVAFNVLSVIVFVSGLAAILQHLRVIQALVGAMAWLMRRTLRTTGPETFGAALLVFMGIESASALSGYLKSMSRSEVFTIMTTFLATIAASVMVAYASFGASPGHLLTASLMSAPAAIAMAKIILPESVLTASGPPPRIAVSSRNIFDAAAQGAQLGLHMALQVGALLIVFVGLIYLCNRTTVAITGAELPTLLGYAFRPFAFLLGIPRGDLGPASELLAVKSVFNEFLAYQQLQPMIAEQRLQERTVTILTYALCGFANPGSLGILIGGLASLAPERRGEIAGMAPKAFLAGTLAAFMTACVAGVLT